MRYSQTTATLLLCLLGTACNRAEGNPVTERAGFCEAALASVGSFMTTQPQPEGERYGGTVVVGGGAELADGMNALVSVDYAANQHQVFVNLMTLIRFDESLEPTPYLAESWQLSDDRTELTFRLRTDVFWHDGTPTTASDVAFTYLRATDPATGFPNAAQWADYVAGSDGVEVLDPRTIRFRLEPHAELLSPWRNMAILPAHLLENVPPEELKQHPFGSECPVGNGPFRFVEHRESDRWVFARNPVFPESLGGPPPLDRYVYRVVPEPFTLLTELLTEGIDVYVGAQTEQAADIRDADATRLVHYPFRSFLFVVWNSRRPHLADARVRRAVTMAIDRAEMVQVLAGGWGKVANASVPPFHFGYDTAIEDSLPYGPEAAGRLLADVGWVDRDGDGIRENADGVPLSITLNYNQESSQRGDVAQIVQAQLAEVGIEVRTQMLEWGTHLEELTNPQARDFDGAVMAWLTDFSIDDTDLFHSERIDGPLGWSGTRNPALDQLLDTLKTVVDRDDARPLWSAYQAGVMAEQPFTFLFFPDRLNGLNRRLRGVRMDARGEWVNIAEWWISEADRKRKGVTD